MLKNYLKTALRNLRAQRSYTLLNIAGLSVGMAGALLVFLFVKHHLSTDRHHARFERIFRIVTDVHLDDGSVEYNSEAPLPMAEALRSDYPQVEQAAFLIMLRELTVGIQAGESKAPLRFREKQGVGLADFAYKIDIAWWYFALAGGLAVGVALLTVSFQSVKAAMQDPVESLRSE